MRYIPWVCEYESLGGRLRDDGGGVDGLHGNRGRIKGHWQKQ